jgi:Icc-related predicted phosphoesterase
MYCCPRQRSARSNGALVRCFGRNHCEDGCLTLVLSTVLAVLCFPVLLFQFASACAARRALRGRRGDCCLQLCSCGGATLYTSAQDDEDRAAFEASLRRRCVAAAGETRYAETKLRVVCLSDTHMQHASIRVPAGDVLVHTGDFTNHGTLRQILDFADWFAAQPHAVKICVPGNHDMIMDAHYWSVFWSDWTSGRGVDGSGGEAPKGTHDEAMEAFRSRGIHVLIDRALFLEISPNGGGIQVVDNYEDRGTHRIKDNVLSIFGSPWVTQYASWQTAFNKLDADMKEHWEGVVEAAAPKHVDLFLTHMPPKGIGDMEPGGGKHGCPHLLEAVKRIAPAVHVFGHVHSDAGVHILDCHGGNRTHCLNAASVCDYYWTGARKPATFDLCPTRGGAVLEEQEQEAGPDGVQPSFSKKTD